MHENKLELLELDPAGEIPESELQRLATYEEPVGGGTPFVDVLSNIEDNRLRVRIR